MKVTNIDRNRLSWIKVEEGVDGEAAVRRKWLLLICIRWSASGNIWLYMSENHYQTHQIARPSMCQPQTVQTAETHLDTREMQRFSR
jgi:hypothetical protein